MNKKLKGLIALLLVAGTLSFGGVCASADTSYVEDNTQEVTDEIHNTSDEAAAKLIEMDSLKVDRTEAKIGDTVKVSFKSKEKIGLAMVQFVKPISRKNETVHMCYNEKTGLYEGDIKITDESESGSWKMTRIMLKGESGEFGNIFDKNLVVGAANGRDLSAADFNVSGTKVTSKDDMDLEGPKVLLASLSIDKHEVYPNDKVKVSLKAEDESGIEQVCVTYRTSEGYLNMAELKYNEADGKYEGLIEADKCYGTWIINDIAAFDKEHNVTYILNQEVAGPGEECSDLSAGNFEVKKIVDVTSPVVDLGSVKALNLSTEKSKNQFLLSLNAADDVSGIDYVKVCYISPSNVSSDVFYLNKTIDNQYEARFGMFGGKEEGTWKIDYIEAADKEGNLVKYTADQYDFCAADLEVEKTPPIKIPDLTDLRGQLQSGQNQLEPVKIDPSTIKINPILKPISREKLNIKK